MKLQVRVRMSIQIARMNSRLVSKGADGRIVFKMKVRKSLKLMNISFEWTTLALKMVTTKTTNSRILYRKPFKHPKCKCSSKFLK